MMFSSKSNIKSWAEVLIGFALLFMGLDALKGCCSELKRIIQKFLISFRSYADMGIIVYFNFYWSRNYSYISSTIFFSSYGFTLVMCYEGYIPFELAAAMVLGENIGTTITAEFSRIGRKCTCKTSSKSSLYI